MSATLSASTRSDETRTAVLAARDLSVRLDGRPIVHDATLRLGAGELVGLVGPNGSGKTTLLRALMGFLPLASGEVRLDDRPLASWSAPERARRMAYVAQGGVCHWPLFVRNVVALGRLPYAGRLGRRDAQDAEAIDGAMRTVHVDHLADRPVTEISGGERMRVMIARALASNPALLLADEPTTSLDAYHQLHTLEILAGLAARGCGILVVLHDLTLAARFCHRIILLDGGRARADGTPDATLEPARLARTFNIAEWPGRGKTGPVLFPWQRVPAASRPPSALD